MNECVLEWRVKASLLDYVGGLVDGVVAWKPGQDPGTFPVADDQDASSRILTFAGGLRLRGHGGLLDILLDRPTLDLASGMLLVGVRQTEEPVAILRLGDPTIDETASGFVVSYPHPTLTSDGAIVFGGYYAEGADLDAVVVRLGREWQESFTRE